MFLKNLNKKISVYPAVYFILWVVLFEFILPVNNILPKPSVVLLSFEALWSDYNFLYNTLSTIGSVYISLLLAYLLVRFALPVSGRNNPFLTFILSLEWFSHYLPGLVIGMFLVYWFPDSEFIEFIFAFLTAFLSLTIKINSEKEKVPEEFILSAKSLGADNFFITKNIIWKSVQPRLFEHILQLHFYLWMLLIAFEFIKGGLGMGVIFRDALFYRDLSALFLNALLTAVIIYLGTLFLKYVRTKFVSWRTV